MDSYEDLIVWQKAHVLAVEVYRISKNFPKEEVYGLTSQLRRAASSVSTNIVEGNARVGIKDRKRFMDISRGSLAETEYLIRLASDIGYVKEHEAKYVNSLITQTGKLLWTFSNSLKP